jgi:16S rRNA (guanine527-N7)-methyltransferase
MDSLDARLSQRAAIAGLSLDASLHSALLAYYEVLLRWNAKVNLTALTDPDEAIDRLLLEPVAAARYLPHESRLIDLGSGGGSPAIPLALALRSSRLVMVESKGRKAAFLREAARQLAVPAVVEGERFETLAAESSGYASGFEVVSMRAVRMDAEALGSAIRFLAPGGRLALFVSPGAPLNTPPGLQLQARTPLMPNAELIIASSNVPRGT